MAAGSNNAHRSGEVLFGDEVAADEDMRQKHRPRYACAPVMRALLAIVLLFAVGTVVVLQWGAGGDVPMPPGGTDVTEYGDDPMETGDPGPAIEVPRITQ